VIFHFDDVTGSPCFPDLSALDFLLWGHSTKEAEHEKIAHFSDETLWEVNASMFLLRSVVSILNII